MIVVNVMVPEFNIKYVRIPFVLLGHLHSGTGSVRSSVSDHHIRNMCTNGMLLSMEVRITHIPTTKDVLMCIMPL